MDNETFIKHTADKEYILVGFNAKNLVHLAKTGLGMPEAVKIMLDWNKKGFRTVLLNSDMIDVPFDNVKDIPKTGYATIGLHKG